MSQLRTGPAPYRAMVKTEETSGMTKMMTNDRWKSLVALTIGGMALAQLGWVMESKAEELRKIDSRPLEMYEPPRSFDWKKFQQELDMRIKSPSFTIRGEEVHSYVMPDNKGMTLCYRTPRTPVTYIPAPKGCELPGRRDAGQTQGICAMQVTCKIGQPTYPRVLSKARPNVDKYFKPGSNDLDMKAVFDELFPDSATSSGVVTCMGNSAYNPDLKKAADGCPPVSKCITERLVTGKNVKINQSLASSNSVNDNGLIDNQENQSSGSSRGK